MTTHTSQRFCLRWNNHQSNLLSVFDQLLHDESFVDVTLAVEGQLLRAHKMVLSACSPYFQALFIGHPDKHPIVILKDVPFADMRCLLDFMYRGEVSVDQDRLTAFLKVAESLRIKGLTEVNEEKRDLPSIANSLLNNSQSLSNQQPPPNLHRIHLTQPSRQTNSPSSFNHPLLGSALLGPKRKRGRPRKLSGSSDTPSINSPEQDSSYDTDSRHLIGSNMSDSSYGIHGPPDLLEVNMSDHGQTSPSLCDEQRDASPEIDLPIYDQSGDDIMHMDETIAVIKKEYPDCLPGSSRDCESPVQIRDTIGASRSKSQTPTNTTERFPSDKCAWKEMIKRLKKPDISIRLESPSDNMMSKEQFDSKLLQNEEFISSSTSGGGLVIKKNELTVSRISSSSSSGEKEEMERENIMAEDTEDDDESMTKVEYDTFKAMLLQEQLLDNNSEQIICKSSSSSSSSSSAFDKSSVRQYCVQIAEHLFQCTLCGKTYTHISNFSRHCLSAHHGLRQEVPCPVCYRIFTRRDNMLTHMKQVHRITIARGTANSFIQKLTDTSNNEG